MLSLWIISLSLLFLYFIRIITYHTGWKKVLRQRTHKGHHPLLSIIISVRNEETGIGLLLKDLAGQDYPGGNFEIIIVDDHSSDGTNGIIRSFIESNEGIRLITLGPSESGKKTALNKGIHAANHSLILCTDGDCRAASGWIREMAAGFSDPAVRMIAGTVIFDPCRGLFQQLQSLEFFSHTAVSAGAIGLNDPILCSAANLMYYKEDYLNFIKDQLEVSESGDDIFLLLWLKRQKPGSIRFNPSPGAVIRTAPAVDLRTFLRQRMRWTSKSRFYRDLHIISTALLVFGLNALLAFLFFACMVAALAGMSFLYELIWLFFLLLPGKYLADLILMIPVLKHYRRSRFWWHFAIMELIYFMYVSFTGISGQILAVSWKGRKINAR